MGKIYVVLHWQLLELLSRTIQFSETLKKNLPKISSYTALRTHLIDTLFIQTKKQNPLQKICHVCKRKGPII